MDRPWKPTTRQLAEARDKTIPDVIGPGLRVLFCGINPGLYSAAVGHHFARPGNRFWPALHRGGFTDRILSPFEGPSLLQLGYGLTNVVDRATGSASELSREEFVAGGRKLVRKLRRHRPRMLAMLGLQAYRMAFDRPHAVVGPQPQPIAEAPVWVLPSPSGLNAHFRPVELARLFRALYDAIAIQ